ncbi:MAG: hypothetical protein R2706_14200 [Acidimicrobiales bacterium]
MQSKLLHQLPLDAVLARADAGELMACVPRLCDLTVNNQLAGVSPVEIFDRLASVWPQFSGDQRASVFSVLTLWWQASLGLYPSDPSPSTVLASLARLPMPLSHWLDYWLRDLDEAQAAHIADLALRGIDSPEWTAVPDKRGQVVGWLKSEPVLTGLTFVAGVHLGKETLGHVLDRLIGHD